MTGIWWEHTDHRGMSRALVEASARARAEAWERDEAPGLSTGTRAADLRVLSLASLWAAERMSRGGPARGPSPTVEDIDPAAGYDVPERRDAALLLLRTGAILMPQDPGGPTAIRTVGGEPPQTLTDAGWVPLAIAAITVAVKWTAVTVGAYLVAREAATVIDRQLVRSEKSRRLIAAQAEAVTLATAHADREAHAGRELPLTEAERAVLANLGAVQAAALEPEKPLHPDSSPWGLLVPALVVVAFLLAKDA